MLQGISSHFEDFRSFGDAIMTISLLSPVYMTLKKPREATNQCHDILAETKVLLKPRSCLIMSGDSRYRYFFLQETGNYEIAVSGLLGVSRGALCCLALLCLASEAQSCLLAKIHPIFYYNSCWSRDGRLALCPIMV